MGPNGLLQQVGHVRVGLLVEGANFGFPLRFFDAGRGGLDFLFVFNYSLLVGLHVSLEELMSFGGISFFFFWYKFVWHNVIPSSVDC